MVFVQQVEDDAVSRGIVSAVVGLAHALELRVVAEGVETEGQAKALYDLGIRCAQGYLWGKPEPMPGQSDLLVLHPPALADDLPGELRRLQAVLQASSSVAQVATVSVQAARRSVGADAGAFAVLGTDGAARMLHAEGYDEDVIARFRVMPLTGDLPTVVALRDRRAVYLQQHALAEHHLRLLRSASETLTALAALPVGEHDVLSVTWSGAVELTPLVRQHLEAMAELITARLKALA